MTQLQEYIREMRPEIENELQSTIVRSIPADYPQLHEMLNYHMGWQGEGAGPDAQGKRIRPLLVLLCAEAAGGNWRDALPAAASVELLHNFSLVHDDIQDNSPLRRSRSTLWVKWGVAQAINAGDILFTLSYLSLQGLAKTLLPEKVIEANLILQKTCLRLTEGQYLDISYETRSDLSLDSDLPMIGGKTSALLGGCAQLGALAGGASQEKHAYFQEFGFSLGLAFQVLDDWLGIWGDVALTGKSVDSDLAAGKKTFPVLYSLSRGGKFAQRWKKGNILPEEAPELASLLDDEGAAAYTLKTAEELTIRSMNALCQAADETPAAQALKELTNMLLTRRN